MSYSPDWECDVFVSFKRVDPAQHFTRDLLKRLYEVGIAHCSDEKTNAPGEFKGNANKAFQQVRFALVILSDGRFDGLVERLKGMKKPELVVIPICYPTDRAVTSRKFADVLGKKANEISGYDLKANSTTNELEKLIDKIVERLVNEIFSRPTNNTTEKVFGPFGRKNEISWRSDEIKNGISAVYNKDGIKRITFEVKDGADTKPQYGGSSEDSTYEVKFEKKEHITSFAGYFDNVKKIITRLTFRTSKRTLGPFGEMTEENFYVPSKGQKVTKFLAGRRDGFVTSIGANVEQKSKKFCPVIVQRLGLIEKESHYKWDDGHHHANVSKIIGKHDSSGVQSIKFEYEEKDGEFWQSETRGQMDGNNSTTKAIEMGPNEALTSIFAVCDGKMIKALTFLTNEKRIETISVEQEIRENPNFTFPTIESDGRIVGFYGWSEGRLCGIGAYAERKSLESEAAWKDKEFFGVRQICLFFDKSGPNPTSIRYIRFVYDDGSEKGRSIIHGDYIGEGLCQEKKVILDYPREYLTSIAGYTQKDGSIKSLTFYSNRKTHGPYCYKMEEEKEKQKEKEKDFWYPSTGSRITGFYGTCGDKTLKSIGVYAEAIPHIYPLKTIEPFGGLGGVEWDDGVHTDVRAYRVSCDNHGLQSVSFMYDDNGSLVEGCQHGGGDVGEWNWLDFPNERLSSITVWKARKENETIITCLEITTIMKGTDWPSSPTKTYGLDPRKEPKSEAAQYDTNLAGHYKMVGFFGRAGESYLNDIGAHLKRN